MNKESFTDILDYCTSGTLISVIKQAVLVCVLWMLHWFYSKPCMGVYGGKLYTGHLFSRKPPKSTGIGPELKFTLY